jgi:hypothetical protein
MNVNMNMYTCTSTKETYKYINMYKILEYAPFYVHLDVHEEKYINFVKYCT